MISLQKLTGSKAHKWQRISALFFVLYLPLMAIYIGLLPEYNSLENIIGNLAYYCVFGYITVVALVLLFIHAWVGGRDIIIDYIPRNHLNIWLNLYFAFLVLIAIDLIVVIFAVNPYF